MSTKIENVVYSASLRDEISADFSRVSFSTAGDDTQNPSMSLGGCYVDHPKEPHIDNNDLLEIPNCFQGLFKVRTKLLLSNDWLPVVCNDLSVTGSLQISSKGSPKQ
jgi:hypothetical protein